MLKESWYLIVAGALALIFVVRDFFDKKSSHKLMETFKDKLQAKVREKRKEAIDRAEEKHDDTVDSDLDDWLDDKLGPKS